MEGSFSCADPAFLNVAFGEPLSKCLKAGFEERCSRECRCMAASHPRVRVSFQAGGPGDGPGTRHPRQREPPQAHPLAEAAQIPHPREDGSQPKGTQPQVKAEGSQRASGLGIRCPPTSESSLYESGGTSPGCQVKRDRGVGEWGWGWWRGWIRPRGPFWVAIPPRANSWPKRPRAGGMEASPCTPQHFSCCQSGSSVRAETALGCVCTAPGQDPA